MQAQDSWACNGECASQADSSEERIDTERPRETPKLLSAKDTSTPR
jgi:hypothetical protein